MTNIPFASWPSFDDEEAEAVKRVLLSNKVNYWTGQEGRLFETEFAKWCGTTHAVAVMNGTVALDLALHALGISRGDEVIVTPRTFIASVSCIVNAGATPIFADVDRESGNITAQSIAKVITSKTRAIICVHLAGWPCDMDPIMDLAKQFNLKVIEDCAQAHGAKYKGRSVGSIGDIGAWSFCQDKIMTTGGEGGMVTTNDESLWRVMWAYKDHGKSYEAVYEREHAPGFRWLHESFGTNWRMLEMQAAIGRIQLKRMLEWTKHRNENAKMLDAQLQAFSGDGGIIRLPQFACINCEGKEFCTEVSKGCTHAYYKYYLYLNPNQLAEGWSRDQIIEAVNQERVPCFSGSCSEVYLEKAFENSPFRPTQRLAVARELGESSLMLLIHPTLDSKAILEAGKVVASVLDRAERK